MRQLLQSLRALLRRASLEREMDDEMRDHLERATERLVARGMSRADAEHAARRDFGNLTYMKEEARDARGARWLESLAGDLRFALRYFARTPLTTATIVFVLALGIGANSALFSVIQAFTTRPAPAVPKDDAHVRIYGMEQQARGARWRSRNLSHGELRALASRTETFSAVAGWTSSDVILDRRDGNGPRALRAEFVTPNFWTTLGVVLLRGSAFAGPAGPAGPVADAPDLSVVISFALSEELFADPADAIGQAVLVDDVPVRIVGVAPPRFQGAVPNNGIPALWLPLSARGEIARSPRWLADSAEIAMFARLAPGVTPEQATPIVRMLAERADGAPPGAVRSAQVVPMRGAPPVSTPDDPLIVFSALGLVALLILLVACTNVSSLLVAAGVGRRHEIAVRLSLGASRARVLRQLVTESTLLAGAGGVAGLLLFWWITRLIATMPLNVEVAPDFTTVGFTLLFAAGTGILFGLSPALHAIRGGTATALRDSGAGVSRRSRLQRTFVVAQIVFSQPLLVMLSILVVAVGSDAVTRRNPVADNVVSARFRPVGEARRSCSIAAGCEKREALTTRKDEVAELARQIAMRPGVAAVVPDAAAFMIRSVTAPGGSGPRAADAVRVHVEGTAPGYFALLDVPIVLGRDIALADTTGDEYAIVIASDLARDLWGDTSPIGRRLASTDWKAGARDSLALVVVGVFDATRATTRGGDRTRVYTAHGKRWRRDVLLVRTDGPAQALAPSLRSFVRAQAPDLPVVAIEPLADVVRRDTREAMQVAGAAGAAGLLALLLACIGLYAVVSLAVGQRRREIGIRIALGGKPSRVAATFFRSGVSLSLVGLLVGLPLSVIGMRLVLSMVIAPHANMPLIGLGIAAVVLLVASAATWLPARRAAFVDPSLALRAE